MKLFNINRLLFAGIIFVTTVSSTAQIQELRKAQDTRIKAFNPTKKTSYFSKSPFVNPFIGTGGHGHTYPGASAPFGMIQLSPDTRYDGWDGCSGYHYSDSIIYGFSHTHLSGTGIPDYADLLIVPQSGTPKTDPGYSSSNGYGSKFSHTSETAAPGYYSVKLLDHDIDVRLTVSERAGFHEYTFNETAGKKFILIDLDHRDKVLSSSINAVNNTTIEGFRISEAWATNQQFYFHLKLNVPYQKMRLVKSNGQHKLLLIFPKATKKIQLKVGISSVDIPGAKKNLETEIPDWDFEGTRGRVNKLWSAELDKISFYSPDKDVMTNFYTALYHSFLAPNIFNDVDGRYRGRDFAIHTLNQNEGENYSVFSLWDTYRATHPLYTLVQQKRTNDFVSTFLRQFDQGGDLPVWELAGNETECMIGYHSVSVISDACTKGVLEFSDEKIERALKAMIATSMFDEFGKKQFHENGFISTGDEPESVSKTLEYSYDDFAIYQMLSAYNGTHYGAYLSEEDSYLNSSLNFINAFDPSTKFMRGRRSGQWFSPFDPAEVNFNYTEANSWQYSLYAPHAVGLLTEMLGGKDSLENWLDRLFTTEMKLSGRDQADITGLIGQYAHGNEPSHHMAYLYNYTNAPHKTQFYTDRILKEMYTNAPDGLSGNEDCGQMSSWYVLSALGFYQIAPGNPYYELGRPLMNEATLQFENGKTLEIKVTGNSPTNCYLQQVIVNEKEIEQHFISHETLMQGGTIEFVMGNNPNKARSVYAHAPTISELPKKKIPVPYFVQGDRVFSEKMDVNLAVLFPKNYTIHYTTNGTAPAMSTPVYDKPITITESTTIRAIAMNEYGISAEVSGEFVKQDPNVSIHLGSTYANQYASTGDLALIDGIKGNKEFRTGDWQGYWAQDFSAEIHFEQGRELSEIYLGILIDPKSWIFFPKSVQVEVSYDGVTFQTVEKIVLPKLLPTETEARKKELQFRLKEKSNVKIIRVKAENVGKCPEWHLGAGNDTWLFFDEISFF